MSYNYLEIRHMKPFEPYIEVQVGTSSIKARLTDPIKGLYVLEEDFRYFIRYKGKSYEFDIPKGFITNFATVPRFAWRLFHPTAPEMLVASCVHDFVLNEFKQTWISRNVKVDGIDMLINEVIDGFLAADLFFFSLSQEGSYNLPIRQFLRGCVKGFYLATLKGWVKVK